jgi:predicted RNA-binding Zn-ribbon protein involved in translation (DUF1610 family)
MTTLRCYDCGFETTDKSVFLGYQSTGDHAWIEFICPQCGACPPRVADARPYPGDPKPPFEEPEWWIETTNYGVYVVKKSEKCTLSNPMSKEHHFWNRPASTINVEFDGTVGEYSEWLRVRGKKRSLAFKEACELLRKTRDARIAAGEPKEDVQKWYDDGVNGARKYHRVGPHDSRKRIWSSSPVGR